MVPGAWPAGPAEAGSRRRRHTERARPVASHSSQDAWALGESELEVVLAEVRHGHTTVVECGSGASTVAVARLLGDLGRGSVHALEHDAGFAARTRADLAATGLDRWATVIEAPLRADPVARPGCRWYAREALAGLPEAIELLLVDGPPASPEDGLARSRYPALPILAERLAPGAVVLLDDADREGERWVIERWEGEQGLRFERRGRLARAVIAPR